MAVLETKANIISPGKTGAAGPATRQESVLTGILFVDVGMNQLYLRIPHLSGEDAEILLVWSNLNEELLEKAQQIGGLKSWIGWKNQPRIRSNWKLGTKS
jgi:hypothetical protein